MTQMKGMSLGFLFMYWLKKILDFLVAHRLDMRENMHIEPTSSIEHGLQGRDHGLQGSHIS